MLECSYPGWDDSDVISLKKEFVSVISSTIKTPPRGATAGGRSHMYRSDTDNDKDVGQHSAVYTVTEDASGDLHYSKAKELPEHAQVDRNHSEHIVVQSGMN